MYKKTIFSLCISIFPLLGFAQRVEYGYDSAGNRISRNLVMNTQNAREVSEDLPDFTAAPNPVYDNLQIRYVGDDIFFGVFSYSIQSISGEVSLSGQSSNPECLVNVRSLSAGYYILNIQYHSTERSIKIIKK